MDKWGAIAESPCESWDKSVANEFLLCCLIDYQTDSAMAWKRGREFLKNRSENDQQELWKWISGHSYEVWVAEDNFRRCSLHWRHAPHNRLWQIAADICFYYEGDPRRIWRTSSLFDALCRLYYLGAGDQISRVIVGALKDCGYFQEKSDVKADIHVCRVLGRIVGEEMSPRKAINLTRLMSPEDPWRLDRPLWKIGRDKCDPKSPNCTDCKVAKACRFAQLRA